MRFVQICFCIVSVIEDYQYSLLMIIDVMLDTSFIVSHISNKKAGVWLIQKTLLLFLWSPKIIMYL